MRLFSLVKDFVDAWFRFHPHVASEKGYRRYDRRPPSFGADDVEAYLAAVRRTREVARELDDRAAPVDVRIELALLRAQLEVAPFEIEVRRRPTTDPLLYVTAALDGLEAVELRAEAGDESARAAVPDRLAAIPQLMKQAAARVVAPVDAFVEVADEMLEAGVEHLEERFGEGEADVRDLAREARRAFEAYRDHLARGETRPFEPMGAEAYGRLLQHEHFLDPDPSSWVALAERTIVEVDAAIGEQPDLDVPEHPPAFGRREILAYYRHELEAVRAFVERHGLVTIPEGRLEMRETPAYLQALIPGASYLPPPPFSRSRTGHLYVRPVPLDMDAEDRQGWFERVHSRSFRNLVAHECWPGHHVQFLHAARHPSPLRRYRDNDVMVEGWGLYSESLVDEFGLWEDVRAPRPLYALRFRAMRVVVDVAIHTGQMTLEQAVAHVCRRVSRGARPWVEAEIRRYAAQPTQAMSYLVGRQLLMELRDEVRAAEGERFDLRAFHDAFLAEGSIPIPLIRRKLLGEG